MKESGDDDPVMEETKKMVNGTLLEAAFVDPAYGWPHADGEGKNAVELQVMDDASFETVPSTDNANAPPVASTTTTTTTSRGFFGCCKSEDTVVTTEEGKRMAKKKKRRRKKGGSSKSNRTVPEGILIYRLDTADRSIRLVSEPSSNTDVDNLLTHMVVADAMPGQDKSRRAIDLVGVDGTKATLVACEQRSAIAWLEAIDMMLGNKGRGGKGKNRWGKEKLNEKERDHVEEQYLNLAYYSNRLIRSSQHKKGKKGSGIYYNVEMQSEQGDAYEEEALESIAKRRAVIKDSWDFYRMICSLLRDRRKYDEVFRKMQLDPVYPYLNSMTGLNDPGDDAYVNADKAVVQKDLEEYKSMSRAEVAKALTKKAEKALPSLVEICKALAGSLGMEEVGVGPIKEVPAALRKAEKKYDGDLLKVTDYCRALLVVKDFPALLALLELARDSFGPLIRRVKLSTLKADRQPLPGGYRDCKINVELKEHICEIQVHLWPMWTVCGVDGFRHYRHCLEYNTDSFGDPYEALEGLDRKTMAELIVMAEEAVADTPLEELEWYQEKFILDYFAEAGLFMKHGLDVWAEITLQQLIKLRQESPDLGPGHHETLVLQKYLEQVLRKLGKIQEADEVAVILDEAEQDKRDEKKAAEKSMWDSIMVAPTEALDMIIDPTKKEREEEEALRKEVKQSKKQWRKIRQERFAFLDANLPKTKQSAGQTSSQ
jgi:hypothetical protein